MKLAIFGNPNKTTTVSKTKRRIFTVGLSLMLSSFSACGHDPTINNTDGGQKRNNSSSDDSSCNLNSYKCDTDQVLYRCEGHSDAGYYWNEVQRCGITSSVCDTNLPGCKLADTGQAQETCNTETVNFDCSKIGTKWQYRDASCDANGVPHYLTNLCGNDNYTSPSLTGGYWISVTFNLDNVRNLSRLIVTCLGKYQEYYGGNDISIQVDELPSKTMSIPNYDSCEPAVVPFEGHELFSNSTRHNIAYDGSVKINLNGVSGTSVWLSQMTVTFCSRESKP